MGVFALSGVTRIALFCFPVTMGTLADDPTIRLTKHIFVRSKAPWFTITDDLFTFESQTRGGRDYGGAIQSPRGARRGRRSI
jgi:hypothetical protein